MSRTLVRRLMTIATIVLIVLIAIVARQAWDALSQLRQVPVGPSHAPTPTMPADAVSGKVWSVYDGDTMTIVLDDGSKWPLRLIGIDAPEMARDGQPAQCGAVDARDRLRQLAPKGTRVVVAHDPKADRIDRYGRHLVYVQAGPTDLAGELALEGLVGAWYPKSEPEPTRFQQYAGAVNAAQSKGLGSWPRCTTLGR